MYGISIYKCKNCENEFGLLYKWYEIDKEDEPICCCICGNENFEFVGDKDIKQQGE